MHKSRTKNKFSLQFQLLSSQNRKIKVYTFKKSCRYKEKFLYLLVDEFRLKLGTYILFEHICLKIISRNKIK